jgi:uroporphyrinogen decarboxylase
MKSRERLLKAIKNEKPDHVPAAPDMWEMVPVRLSGKNTIDVMIYMDPPIWKAQIDAYRYYGVDAFVPLFTHMEEYKNAIVYKDDERTIVRGFQESDRGIVWSPLAQVFSGLEPSAHVQAKSIGLPDTHDKFEIVKPAYKKYGKEYYDDVKDYLKDDGVVFPMVFLPALPIWEDEILRYYDEHDAVLAEMEERGRYMIKQAEIFLSWNPDGICIGNSGMMITNPPHIFREIGLKWLKKVTKLAKDHGVPTHLHCCGPERSLVEIAANETDLGCIEPLEIPPMGDCNLGEIKQKFGKSISLKGNLHTTEIMLFGTPEQVEDACKKAIDDAAEGGGFVLSTGDQTPRDTPDRTIEIMRRVAETYGKY